MIKEEYSRYSRQIMLDQIGTEGQLRIKNAKVLVIGAGGLGCPVLQYIAAAGVGTIGIMDGDVVEISNLQRQILFSQNDIGKNKAQVACQKLKILNPHIDIRAYEYFASLENIDEVFQNYDLIADCTDNFGSRYLINDSAIRCNKPVVYAALFKFQGQVSVFNYKGGPSYRCLFPKETDKDNVENCKQAGVWSILPGIIGCMQANEILKVVANIGDVLSGRLLTYDSTNNQSFISRFGKKEVEFAKALQKESVQSCYMPELAHRLKMDDFKELSARENTVTIDLRELDEINPSENFFDNVHHLPFSNRAVWQENLDQDKRILLFCASGRRSARVMKDLLAMNFDVYDLKNGIQTNKILAEQV